MNPVFPIIDSGTALGGRLSWAHVGTDDSSNVLFSVDGSFARMATEEFTQDTAVIGVDVDLVYVAYGRDIVRFNLLSDGTVVAIDPIPVVVAGMLSTPEALP